MLGLALGVGLGLALGLDPLDGERHRLGEPGGVQLERLRQRAAAVERKEQAQLQHVGVGCTCRDGGTRGVHAVCMQYACSMHAVCVQCACSMRAVCVQCACSVVCVWGVRTACMPVGTISSLSSVSTLSWSCASFCAAASRSTIARRTFSKQMTLSAQGSPPPHCTRCTLEICVEASSASIGSVTPKAALARRGVNRPVTQEQRSLMVGWTDCFRTSERANTAPRPVCEMGKRRTLPHEKLH